MIPVKTRKWSWRDVVLRIALGLRTRTATCQNITGRPEEEIEVKAKRFAYSALADDLVYLATMPPHEAIRYLRDNYR